MKQYRTRYTRPPWELKYGVRTDKKGQLRPMSLKIFDSRGKPVRRSKWADQVLMAHAPAMYEVLEMARTALSIQRYQIGALFTVVDHLQGKQTVDGWHPENATLTRVEQLLDRINLRMNQF